MKKVAVLGSSGQIGSHLVHYLREKDYEVTGYDLVSSDTTDVCGNLKSLPTFSCSEASKVDFVYFLAFDVGGSRYLKQYQYTADFMHNNMALMSNVFSALKSVGTPFIFTSSQMANMSFSPYGILKRIGELITASMGGLVVKFWNVYGIEHDLEKAHVITDFILMSLKNKKIKMMTNGAESREFLHADDCSIGLEVIMNNHTKFKLQNKELHLTTGKETKIIEIAKIIQRIAKKDDLNINIFKGKKKDTVQRNRKNKYNQYLSKFWEPKVNIEVGIREIYKYYKYNLNKIK